MDDRFSAPRHHLIRYATDEVLSEYQFDILRLLDPHFLPELLAKLTDVASGVIDLRNTMHQQKFRCVEAPTADMIASILLHTGEFWHEQTPGTEQEATYMPSFRRLPGGSWERDGTRPQVADQTNRFLEYLIGILNSGRIEGGRKLIYDRLFFDAPAK